MLAHEVHWLLSGPKQNSQDMSQVTFSQLLFMEEDTTIVPLQ